MSAEDDMPPSQFKTKRCPQCLEWNANRAGKCSKCGTTIPNKRSKINRKKMVMGNFMQSSPAPVAATAVPAELSDGTYRKAMEFVIAVGGVDNAFSMVSKLAGKDASSK